MYKKIFSFFDKLEDHVRGSLSKYPIFYAFLGGSGVILFWRGIWHTADYLEENTFIGSIIFSDIGSMILGMIMLLISGLFVSVFIGDSILISGLKKEKKITEKTSEEIDSEKDIIEEIDRKISHLEGDIHSGNICK